MAYIKFDGFDKINEELDRISKQAEELSGHISFGELFNDEFVQEHTQFSNIDEFFESGGFIINREEDFNSIPQDKLDKHVKETTEFSDWEDMLSTAGAEYTAKELGLD